MKTNVKKSLAVFAAILTAASAFAGCSSESTSTESTSAETTVSAVDTAELSKLRYPKITTKSLHLTAAMEPRAIPTVSQQQISFFW